MVRPQNAGRDGWHMRDSHRISWRSFHVNQSRWGLFVAKERGWHFQKPCRNVYFFPPLHFSAAPRPSSVVRQLAAHFTSALMCPQSNLYNLVGLSDRKMTLPSEIPVRNSDQSAGLLLPSTHRIKENKNALSKLAASVLAPSNGLLCQTKRLRLINLWW